MDVSLAKLGKVAGVPGIALGVAALILGAVAEGTPALPEAWRGPVAIVLAVGGVLLGVVGLLGWSFGKWAMAQVAEATGRASVASNVDTTSTGGAQRAKASGDGSSAMNQRGR